MSSWANNYIGIPFKWNGDGRDGASCYGLVKLVYREVFSISLPAYDEVEAEVKDGKGGPQPYIATPGWTEVPLDEAKSGDVIHMWGVSNGRRTPTHCGIVVEPGLVLHAEDVVGSCVSRYKGDNRFLNRIIGAYRLATR